MDAHPHRATPQLPPPKAKARTKESLMPVAGATELMAEEIRRAEKDRRVVERTDPGAGVSRWFRAR